MEGFIKIKCYHFQLLIHSTSSTNYNLNFSFDLQDFMEGQFNNFC